MTSTRLWDRAALVPVAPDGRRRPEIVALAPGIPTIDELFTFMRDAELRFETLRMRIEERTFTARGDQLVVMEVALRHPGHARVTTSEPDRGTAGNYEIWLSDGAVVRTYSAPHRLGTERPVRPSVRGVNDSDMPGPARVYVPVTPLPMETLPETFVHPAGYCQNVLATGRCWISGTDIAGGREAIVLECDHPRTVERVADRPDFHIRIAVDRLEGVITRLTETIDGEVTRDAEVVVLEPNASLPPDTFEFRFPSGTTMLY
jgi:outer membrane lipoprotein-sorting protein